MFLLSLLMWRQLSASPMSHGESPIYQGFKFVLSMKVLKPPKSGVPVKPVDIAEKQRLLVVVEAYEVGC